MPTLYLSNWSSHRTPGHHGPGRKLSIMLWTPRHTKPDGHVFLLTPSEEREVDLLAQLLRHRKAGSALPADALASYRGSLEARWERYLGALMLGPGSLAFALNLSGRGGQGRVRDGDTLLCACSRDEAAVGRCHRAFAAPFLVRAGWRVVLDGKEFAP